MKRHMEIERAPLPQVTMSINGRKIPVESDVFDVVRRLQEISPRLFVNYIEQGDYFAIVEHCKDNVERLVTTTTKLTPDVVEHVRKIGSDSWDVGKEMDRMDDAAARSKKHQFFEKIGEIGERLHHALKKDLSYDQSRIWLPERLKEKVG